jgi:four helix bundle protein
MAYLYAFEKMAVWQLARQSLKKIYLETKGFPKDEMFGLTSQVRRAGLSICCNLAEGSARFSEKEQCRFYEIAYGSAVEIINLLMICSDLDYLPEETYSRLRQDCEKLTYQINKLYNNPKGFQEPDSPYEIHPDLE